ncbi:MFS transporter [Streptomyces sp. NPDC059193]|uniref:MFS transporter n=1 Tax=Streptomyces sp. NPDC059193 TaxID=3346763 RepID=UPI00368DAA6C
MTVIQSAPPEAGFVPAATGRRRSIALFVVLLAMFMDLLDNTIINVALPSIHQELGGAYSAVQWIAGGYTLAFALALITGSRLGDIFGRKRLFLTGAAGFTIASALCGISQSPAQLISARVIQGVMAAMMVPQVLAVIQTMYAPKDRGKAIGMFGALAGLATVGGPILGALLTSGDIAGLGWRSIFLVNVPVGIIALVLAVKYLPESTAPDARRLDLAGVLLSSLALLLLIYPLIKGQDAGWPAWTFASMAGAVAALGLFVAQQRLRTRSGKPALVELGLFRYRSFTGGLLVGLLFMGGVVGYFLVFAIYLQTGLGFSVLRSGLTGIPWGLLVPVLAGIGAAVLAPKLGRRVLQIGLVVDIAAMFVLMWTVNQGGVTSIDLIPGLALGGIGMGLVVAPLLDFTLADVPVASAGSASGLYNTIQQVGGAIGIAGLGAYFFSRTGHQIPSPATYTPAFQHTLWLPIAAFTAALAATFLMPKRAAHHDTTA